MCAAILSLVIFPLSPGEGIIVIILSWTLLIVKLIDGVQAIALELKSQGVLTQTHYQLI